MRHDEWNKNSFANNVITIMYRRERQRKRAKHACEGVPGNSSRRRSRDRAPWIAATIIIVNDDGAVSHQTACRRKLSLDAADDRVLHPPKRMREKDGAGIPALNLVPKYSD